MRAEILGAIVHIIAIINYIVSILSMSNLKTFGTMFQNCIAEVKCRKGFHISTLFVA